MPMHDEPIPASVWAGETARGLCIFVSLLILTFLVETYLSRF